MVEAVVGTDEGLSVVGGTVGTPVGALEGTTCTNKIEFLMVDASYQLQLPCQVLKRNTMHLHMQCNVPVTQDK